MHDSSTDVLGIRDSYVDWSHADAAYLVHCCCCWCLNINAEWLNGRADGGKKPASHAGLCNTPNSKFIHGTAFEARWCFMMFFTADWPVTSGPGG